MSERYKEFLKLARQRLEEHKEAFVAGGGMDPAMAGAAAGGMPMDPAAMGGGGGMPMAGGAPPADPMAASPPAADPATIAQQVAQILQQQGMGGAGAGAGGLKPKIDVNVEIMQMKNLLSKIVDALGIPVPTQDMVATPDKLQAMAAGQPPGGAGAGAAGGAAGPQGPIPPIEPMEPAMMGGAAGAPPAGGGKAAYDLGSRGLRQSSDRAAALAAALAASRNGSH